MGLKKRVAVMMCAISFDNQRKILEGIMSYARQVDEDVYVFTNHVNYDENELSKEGAFQIMELPEFETFDGVIIAKNTIHYVPAVERLIARIRKSGVRAVSIDEAVEGFPYMGISNYEAQKMVVRHLISVHGKRRIAYVAGDLSSKEGRERYSGYRDALEEAGLVFEPDLVYRGRYDVESGRRSVMHMLGEGTGIPEAVVCANDSMAVGVAAQLKELGYRIPEEVAVTGFDGDEIAQYHMPSITTVDRNQRLLGQEVLRLLLEPQEPSSESSLRIKPSVRIGHSCGCRSGKDCSAKEIRQKFTEKVMSMQQASDSIKSMISEFAGLEREEALIEALKKYVIRSDMKSFYLCLREKEKAPEGGTGFRVSLAYEQGNFVIHKPVDRERILPDSVRHNQGCRLFIVTPVYYQNYFYGYCVSGDSYFPLKSELFYSWVLNIGIGLENIRKLTLLNETVEKLNGMWVYDMLTHIYNRAGFFHFSAKLLEELREGQKLACIIFADIDGLKKVNDTLGHKKGDSLIREVAEILRRNLREDQLLMRYGGDEFVIFGRTDSREDTEKQIEGIQKSFCRINESGGRDYSVEVSIGFSVYAAEEIEELSDLIEQADGKMYAEKKKRKVCR